MNLRIKDKGELVFAGLLLALGIFVLLDTATIRIPVAASNVGPRFMPYAVGILLTVSTIAVIVGLLRGHSAEPEESELVDPKQPFNWRRVLLVIASIIAFGVLLEPLGYVLAAAITFFGVATTLGARRYWLTAIVSVVLSVSVYLLFTRPLGIYLPNGVFTGIF